MKSMTAGRLGWIAIVAMALAVTATAYAAAADDATPPGDTVNELPVEPDGGIGDTPLPVEPDGGIGDGA